MTSDMQRVVAAGYDDVADAYLERFGISTVREKWLRRLIHALPATGSRVLDLGCGLGIPVARDLAALGHIVVGIDGSSQQIVRARHNVPQATFIEADMCSVTFEGWLLRCRGRLLLDHTVSSCTARGVDRQHRDMAQTGWDVGR